MVPASGSAEPPPAASGQRLFARYAYAPNHLGYCGPSDSASLAELASTGRTAGDVRSIASRFSGAWPYLCVLAEVTGIDDPLDEAVVRAYWTGSPLLDEVNRARFWRKLLDRIAAAGAGRYWAHLTPALLSEAMPTHGFHVFGVYPWTRLLPRASPSPASPSPASAAAVGPALRVLDSCRIRWGRVTAVDGGQAVVRGRRLAWDGQALRLGEETEDSVRLTDAGRAFVADVSPGDWLAVHWDLACDRLTADELGQLRRWTDWQLAATNARLARTGFSEVCRLLRGRLEVRGRGWPVPLRTLGTMSETPQVDIVVPVKNEEHDLGPSVGRLVEHLRRAFPFTARVTIADNGSTDGTWPVACALEARYPEVRAVHLDIPGRGRALHQIWSSSDAEVLAYMDVDLSTDLNALLPLVAPLMSGHSDVAIGTRLARGSRVVRGPKREIISRSYNLLLRTTLGTDFSDAQCGFKAIRADQARQLLPLVEDKGWFFDTELLVLAERAGLRIHEVPVDWIDDADSRVNIVDTALGDLRGMKRVGLGLARGTLKVPQLRATELGPRRGLAWQLPRFAAVGVLSTLAYIVVYLALRSFVGAQAANALSLLLTAVGNTAANRRLTFGLSGRAGAAVHHFRGLIAFGVCLVLTSGALMCLHAVSASPGHGAEIAVLVAANLVATALRFVLYRGWVFALPTATPVSPATATTPTRQSLGDAR